MSLLRDSDNTRNLTFQSLEEQKCRLRIVDKKQLKKKKIKHTIF